MTTLFRRTSLALLIALLGLCVPSALAGEAPPPASGFLEPGIELVSDPDDGSLLWWERADFDWQDYDAILLDPVEIAPHPEAHQRALESERLPGFIEACVAQLEEQLGGTVAIVDEPGPRVLRIRAAITDVETVSPAANVLASLALFVRVDLGGASVEAEFLDGATGERLAAMRDSDEGSVWNAFRGFRRHGDARAACRHWGRALRKAFEGGEECAAQD